ncbi:class F sortase [Acrocarpospora pleiomorpha]|uniref:Class F sortase n=1 Tax=Acrocarpospora pleiomorpha TaxID=90975 RepID=A0A5M3X882_9ACTN|nr:class F sortase [Acrocarpospora pleiomorpha]GES17885.1 class F sortase [Acrocarpospora pleiomorpha]
MSALTVRGGLTLATATLLTIGCGTTASAGIPAELPQPVALQPAAAIQKDVADPVRLNIPAIGVSTKVIALPLDREGRLVAPRQFDRVGWNKAGPEPGEKGVAVIAGHVDSKTGPAVFYRLRQLSKGDRIHVHRKDGTKVTFTVQRVARYPKNRIPNTTVYTAKSGTHLRLITCGGTFDRSRGSYRDNIVVFAR